MKRASKASAFLAAIASLTTFSSAHAVEQYCTGLVAEYLVYSDESLMPRAVYVRMGQ